MRKLLILSIFIFIFCFLPKIAEAGIITKPVFHTGLIGYWDFQEGAGKQYMIKVAIIMMVPGAVWVLIG